MGAATTTQPTEPWRRRVPSLAALAYVAALAIWTDGGASARGWLTALAAMVAALVASGRRSGPARAAGWGAAVVLASLGAQRGSGPLDAAGGVGLFACTAAACVAVARIPSEGGVLALPRPSRRARAARLAAVWSSAAAWWTAIVADVGPQRVIGAWMSESAPAWSWVAMAVSAAAIAGSNEWALRSRRLELGVAERTRGMRSLLVVLLVSAGLVAALGHHGVHAVTRLGIAAAGVIIVAGALAEDAVRVVRVARRTVVLATAGAGVALLGASVASEGNSGDVWRATVTTAAVTLAIGSAAAFFEDPLRPGGGAWLDAFARACDEAVRADPEDAIREVLLALRGSAGIGFPSPELWSFAPGRALSVDAAGYLHERDADLPETLVMTAVAEPYATLRADVLDELEVRRPELRAPAKWMTQRGAALATVVAADGEIEGVLVLPRGAREDPPTLEEVRALKQVANRLAGACRARGARSRLLDRAQEAVARAEAAEQQIAALSSRLALDPARHVLAAGRLARPATVGVYGVASRAALEALERLTAAGAPLAVVAASGIDPVPYLARAHLAGARRAAPFVLVDATDAREHDLARWTDPSASPLALAHGGMLALLHGAALPADVQQLVARACAERRAPWSSSPDPPGAVAGSGGAGAPDGTHGGPPLDVELALTGIASPDDLVAEGRLNPALAARLGDARSSPVTLPRLAERPEDLRAIVTDRLAREGLRVLGRPVGIDHAAYARLMEHAFPGDDVELAAIAVFLVARCSHDVVRAADVDALHLTDLARSEDGQASRRNPLSA